jgi:hypothetical protein
MLLWVYILHKHSLSITDSLALVLTSFLAT